MTTTPGLVNGTLGRTSLSAQCAGGRGSIDIYAERGNSMHAVFGEDGQGGFSTEIYADFPMLAGLTRTAVIEDTSANPLTGYVRFEADTGTEWAYSEFALDGSTSTYSGDPDRVNAAFASTLNASTIWKDVNVLVYAAAGMWDPGVRQHEGGLDLTLDLAIPSEDPFAAKDKDVNGAMAACGTASVTCGAAAIFLPLTPLCEGAMATCLSAFSCVLLDCQGDG